MFKIFCYFLRAWYLLMTVKNGDCFWFKQRIYSYVINNFNQHLRIVFWAAIFLIIIIPLLIYFLCTYIFSFFSSVDIKIPFPPSDHSILHNKNPWIRVQKLEAHPDQNVVNAFWPNISQLVTAVWLEHMYSNQMKWIVQGR